MTDKTPPATEQAVADTPRKRAAKRTASASKRPAVKTVVTPVTTSRRPRAAKAPAAVDPAAGAPAAGDLAAGAPAP
ncbi:polyphosphate kinase 2, partial [Achromobacter xylosoxidans]